LRVAVALVLPSVTAEQLSVVVRSGHFRYRRQPVDVNELIGVRAVRSLRSMPVTGPVQARQRCPEKVFRRVAPCAQGNGP
jgi:hypothetical protein